jgi:hypothetical protein
VTAATIAAKTYAPSVRMPLRVFVGFGDQDPAVPSHGFMRSANDASIRMMGDSPKLTV